MTNEDVYNVTRQIPKGRVSTYGEIARLCGCPGGARAVGNALHNNPEPGPIPCHRVVNSQGKLAEHFGIGGIQGQKIRLEAEGVTVINGKVDLAVYRWLI